MTRTSSPLWVDTPVWQSGPLSTASGKTTFLKMEAFQPTGSFKARGMGAACVAARDAGATRVVCSSGGNAGYSVAYAARQLGLPATIVVPRSTTARARTLIAQQAAEVIVHGEVWDEAHAYATELAARTHAAYVHPFDDPIVWAGHAEMIRELVRQVPKPGAVVASVGGGGLLVGVVQGLRDVGWTDVPVLAVETEGAASFASSFRAGELVTLERIDTVAVTLGARRVALRSLELARIHPMQPWLVSDRAAVDACLRFADDHRVLVEPACGAALAAVYDIAEPLAGCDSIVVVVCGGVAVTLAMLDEWNRSVVSR
ncbi:MAG: pyridoxal-phosphate dependent enzyme [Vicinamibacterales bacterium]